MSDTPSIEERLEFLEDQNEGLKRVGLLLVILVVLMGVGMIVQSRNAAESIKTGGVIFTNEGASRTALTTMPTGHLGMVQFDANETISAEMNSQAVPPMDGMVMYDRAGNPRLMLGIDDQGNPFLILTGKDGRPFFSALDPSVAKAVNEAQAGQQPAATPTPAVSPTP